MPLWIDGRVGIGTNRLYNIDLEYKLSGHFDCFDLYSVKIYLKPKNVVLIIDMYSIQLLLTYNLSF